MIQVQETGRELLVHAFGDCKHNKTQGEFMSNGPFKYNPINKQEKQQARALNNVGHFR